MNFSKVSLMYRPMVDTHLGTWTFFLKERLLTLGWLTAWCLLSSETLLFCLCIVSIFDWLPWITLMYKINQKLWQSMTFLNYRSTRFPVLLYTYIFLKEKKKDYKRYLSHFKYLFLSRTELFYLLLSLLFGKCGFLPGFACRKEGFRTKT